jgi:hypothetical protein
VRILDVEQGSPEWFMARSGIPTASNFDRILTPKQRKYASGAGAYRDELLAEWLLGMPLDHGTTAWMDRGTILEPEARRWYTFQTGREVAEVGFVLRDDGMVGGSPDGFVGDDGGVEIKCPGPAKQVPYLLGEASTDHTGQIQGLLMLTGRQWWDLVIYNPVLPSVVMRVERDEAYIADLAAALDRFVRELREGRDRLAEYRVEVAA